MAQYYVYIMTNATRTLYIGVMNDIPLRQAVHRMTDKNSSSIFCGEFAVRKGESK